MQSLGCTSFRVISYELCVDVSLKFRVHEFCLRKRGASQAYENLSFMLFKVNDKKVPSLRHEVHTHLFSTG